MQNGLVKMTHHEPVDGIGTLEVDPSCVAAHMKLGWRVAPSDPDLIKAREEKERTDGILLQQTVERNSKKSTQDADVKK